MTRTDDSPWLAIPASDYEAHMQDIGQSAALRLIFQRVYDETRPRRLLVLGCTTGKDLLLVDPTVTTTAWGVDVNLEYLAIARAACARLGTTVQLIQGDVLGVDLPSSGFDLIHAALLVEYVDPAALFRRIGDWLAPTGVCSIVSQNPAPGIAPVSKTAYDSLLSLDGCMSLVGPDQLTAFAIQAGLDGKSVEHASLPGNKSFSVSIFGKSV